MACPAPPVGHHHPQRAVTTSGRWIFDLHDQQSLEAPRRINLDRVACATSQQRAADRGRDRYPVIVGVGFTITHELEAQRRSCLGVTNADYASDSGPAVRSGRRNDRPRKPALQVRDSMLQRRLLRLRRGRAQLVVEQRQQVDDRDDASRNGRRWERRSVRSRESHHGPRTRVGRVR